MKSLPLLLALCLAGCGPTMTDPASPPPPGSSGPSAPTASSPPPAPAGALDTAEIEAAVKANDADKARKLADAALAKSPKNPKAHYYAGLAAEMNKDLENAEKHYRGALALLPTFNDAAVNLSAILLDTKRAADAAALLKPLVEKMPDDPLLLSNYAVALAESGDHAQAAAVYAKLVQKDPKPETRLGYAGELIASGKKDEAAKTLREGLAQAGDDRDMLAAFGRALGKAGAFEDAIKALDKAIKVKPGADLFTYRALFKRSSKDLPGARADLEAANKEDPKFAPAYVYLGEILEEMKKPADARKAYEQAIKADPEGGTGKRAKERLDAMKSKK